MSKPFFFRITAGDLLDFATDPEGEGMTLLRFAKELQKGESDVEFIQSIIDEASNYIEKKRKAGAKGGKAKSSSAKAVLENAVAEPSIPLASSSSSSSNKEPKPKPLGEYPESFLDFWTAYPKKKAKGAAYKAWGKIKQKDSTLKAILVALKWQKVSEDWMKDRGQYIPHPSTYLNAAGWEDEQPERIEEQPLFMSLDEMEATYGNTGMAQSDSVGGNPVIEITQFEECTEGHGRRS
jgi:hypothetical protein